MMMQQVYEGSINGGLLSRVIEQLGLKKLLLVADRSLGFLPYSQDLQAMAPICAVFSDFAPNPDYESVAMGVDLFHGKRCDGVLAVGGGSAIDVAKCIKLFSGMRADSCYLDQPYEDTGVSLIAIPTTAGTGSESTRYAVIYRNGVKQSVTHESIIPNVALLDSSALQTLPLYQKKCTLMDAACQAIESWWSVNSTQESMDYSKQALTLCLTNLNAYLSGDEAAAKAVMRGANLAGRAINITQTTAPHAMSYQLTKMFALPHGYAVALSLPDVWEYMLAHVDQCVDKRGAGHLQSVFEQIADAMGCQTPQAAIDALRGILDALDMHKPPISPEQLTQLVGSVNPVRLKNNPVALSTEALSAIYQKTR